MSYKFKTKPYDHQIEVLKICWARIEYALFMEMGTGKSKVIIDNACALYEKREINGLFITAPKGAYLNWLNQVRLHIPDRVDYHLTYWTPNPNYKERNSIRGAMSGSEPLLYIFIMNIEALSTKKGVNAATEFLNSRECMFAVDESTTIKNRAAKRTKNVIELGKLAKFRRILTGSPVTQSPLDLYSQCEFLGNVLGFKSFYAFRNHYAIMRRQTMGPRSFQTVVGFREDRLEKLAKHLKIFSYRKLKSECLDLPPKVYEKRIFKLSKLQQKAYDEMRRYAIAEFEEGEATVDSVITSLLRLHQITCGFIPRDDGEVEIFENERLTVLLDLIDEIQGQKIIIWAHYIYNIKEIEKVLKEKFGEESTLAYFGETKGRDRPQINAEFQDLSSPLRFLVANKAGAYGIDLFASHDVIYFSNNYDLDVRMQSEDRAHRIGQEHSVTYTDIVAERTVDEKILTCLRNKKKIASVILDQGNIADFI